MYSHAVVTYLKILQGKVYKLLPMRESYDRGDINYLYEYIDYLKSTYTGALVLYPELCSNKSVIEVGNNIAYLLTEKDIPFEKWRAIVFKSTRLVQRVLDKCREGCVYGKS